GAIDAGALALASAGAAVAKPAHLGGGGAAAIDVDALAKLDERLFAGAAGDLGPICLGERGAGAQDFVGELAVVGEQQEPFGVEIEAADGVEALVNAAQVVLDAGAAFGIVERGHHALGFVKEQVMQLAGGAKQLAL